MTSLIEEMIARPASLASAQAVMFFGPGTEMPGNRVLRHLPEDLFELFDGEPVLAPTQGPFQFQVHIPGFALPTIVLNRRDGNAQLSIGASRADVVCATGQLDGSLGSFFVNACSSLLTVRRALRARVPRVASIVHRYRATQNPGRALAEQFCRAPLMENGPLNRPESFELHAHKVFRTTFGMNVNSWVRNRTGLLAATNTPVVSVEQDINTLPTENGGQGDLDDAVVTTFFREITAELDRALALYYPTESAEP